MPRGDRTGPEGMGSMTGRGLGYCAGYDSPGYTKGVPRGGAGFGGGRGFNGGGFGRGFRGGFQQNLNRMPVMPNQYAPVQMTQEQELSSLKQNAEYLKQNLENVFVMIAICNGYFFCELPIVSNLFKRVATAYSFKNCVHP